VDGGVKLVRAMDVTTRWALSVAELSPLSANGVLLETLVGRYVLNREGREVWLLIDGRRGVGDIAGAISHSQGIAADETLAAVRDISDRLVALGLVDIVEGSLNDLEAWMGTRRGGR